ncbi:MAG: hypothetical protein JXL80_17880 [Planctomycetes bacterium]|nr:hypothetical protein [Planctomycetota bacterium]
MSHDEQAGTGDECTQDKLLGKPQYKLPGAGTELQMVLYAWPKLPRAVRAGILAMVKAYT